jgi:hypothetical protein
VGRRRIVPPLLLPMLAVLALLALPVLLAVLHDQ